MSRRQTVLVAVATLAVLAGCVAAFGPTAADDGPPDPDGDPLGWENGYWHNESVDIADPADLTDAELEAVVARTAARVEVVRDREFAGDVSTEVISRAEFRERTGGGDLPTDERLGRNAVYEALFFVGEDTDAVSTLAANRAGGVLGYYAPGRDDIVLVAPDGTVAVSERTLAHELVHALQDQRFDTGFGGPTIEATNVVQSVTEGDATYVEYRYGQRCGETWDCLTPDQDGSDGYAHAGAAFLQLFPYSDGAAFVAGVHRERGWAGVDALYEDPPASTEQVIHPERFGTDPPTAVRVTDRSGPAWRPLDANESLGEAGLFTMLWYPSYRNGTDEVVPLNISDGPLPDRYDYAHRYTAGWDGDRLAVYAREDSAATNETAYVWKTAWDSPAEAREFVAGYRELLAYHDARRVGPSTYVISGEFGDAVHLELAGDTVTIVNAPTVEDLPAVREGVTAEAAATTTPADTAGPTATTDRPTTRLPGTPGFGPGVALVALALAVAGRRRR